MRRARRNCRFAPCGKSLTYFFRKREGRQPELPMCGSRERRDEGTRRESPSRADEVRGSPQPRTCLPCLAKTARHGVPNCRATVLDHSVLPRFRPALCALLAVARATLALRSEPVFGVVAR